MTGPIGSPLTSSRSRSRGSAAGSACWGSPARSPRPASWPGPPGAEGGRAGEPAGARSRRTSRPEAKRVIFLFMNGGPSHVDTFDPKPSCSSTRARTRPSRWQPERQEDRGGLMPSPFKFARHGQSGIEVSELFPELASCVDDLCVDPVDVHRQPESRAVAADDELGQHAADPAEPRLVAALRPGHREPEPARASSSSAPASRSSARSSGATASCRASIQGTHINNKTVDPERIIRDIRNRHLSHGRPARAARPAAATEPRPPRGARPRRASGSRGSRRWRWPSGCSPRPARRSTSADESNATRDLTATASSPTPAWSPAAWSSAGCA